jgi:putative FmdB family regulatory protein
MPLYEYLCKKCGHRFERIQKFSDPHVKKCPDCRGAVEQVISAPAVQFKGSGWYVTDYAKKSSGSGSSSSSDSDSGSKSESKSDSTPESSRSESKSDSSKAESKSESKKDDKPRSEKKSRKD